VGLRLVALEHLIQAIELRNHLPAVAKAELASQWGAVLHGDQPIVLGGVRPEGKQQQAIAQGR
jgi:hypothetical protein